MADEVENTESPSHGRILIIEDDLLIADQIEDALAEAGFNVVGSARTGAAALELVRTRSPNLAVMDIRLSGDRDGVNTAIEMFRTHGLRCIFASAYSDREARDRAAPASPVGWLQKPYTMAHLVAMVRRAVKKISCKDAE